MFSQTVFINEIHYDNAASDVNQGFEIAAPAGTNLACYRLVLYNGSNGTSYFTLGLSGIVIDEGCGYGTLWFPIPTNPGIQNGAPDGVALYNSCSFTLTQFLSYEGSFTAVSGVANGITATDIGVSEPNSTPIGQSLQLMGTGTNYADFTWGAPSASSNGAINAAQNLCTQFCGDGICTGTETNANCPGDCPPACGDGVCNGVETNATCPGDCPTCGDGLCTGNENSATCPGDCPPITTSIIINEISQGLNSQEYVEFIVTGPVICNPNLAPCLDLRNWIFDDNNGKFSAQTGVGEGVATGASRFTNTPFWSCIPAGTRILIYNDADPNPDVAPDDLSMADGNCSLVIPISSFLFEQTLVGPTPFDPSYTTNNADWATGGGWGPISMANGDDSFQIYNPNDLNTPVFGVSWGNNNLNNQIYMGPNSASAEVFSFLNTNNDNPSDQTNWGTGPVATDQTPGNQNNNNNWDWMATMNPTCRTPLALSLISTNVSCLGLCNGSAITNMVGDVTPYTYNWSNSNTTTAINSLCPGTYSLTVSDYIGCTITETTTITEPPALSFTAVTTQNETCAGACDGISSSSALGGTAPYSYLWSNGSNLSLLSNICPNSYSVTVTDANGCTATATLTITPGVTLTAGISPLVNQCLLGNSFLFDGSSSTISTGSISSYSWLYGDGGTGTGVSPSHSYVASGTFTVTLTVSNGICSNQTTTTVLVSPMPTVTTTPTNPLCSGGNSGSITATAAAGTPTYTYNWNIGIGQTQSNLAPGSYTVTVTDLNLCSVTATAVLTAPPALSISPVVTSVTCNGFANGTLGATATGGTGAITYSWSSLGAGQNQTSVAPGIYTVTATDANSCSITTTATVIQPLALTLTVVNTSITCPGNNNGTATASGIGGIGTLTYNWSNGSSGSNITGLTNSNYTITVTDGNNCTATATTTIISPSPITVTAAATPASCNGVADGGISASAAGGEGTLNYAWSNGGGTAATNNALSAGTYTVTVTDGNSCIQTATAIITEPSPVNVSTIMTPALCNGIANGTAIASATGGTSPYNYQWDGGTSFQTSAIASALLAATYAVTVNDANSCTATTTIVVTQPAAITLTTTANDASCGNADGAASVAVVGGTAPYSYLWNTSATASNISTLTAATYTVTVTDASGCTQINTALINDAGAPSLTIINVVSVSCNGGSNGSAEASVSGGTPAYSYHWTGGITSPIIANITAGNYSVTITDSATPSCVATANVTIAEPTPITASITGSLHPLCNGGNGGFATVSAAGGTTNYTYNWGSQTTTSATGLTAGSYTVTVTDANACSVTTAVTLVNPPALTITSTPIAALCNGAASGTINSTVIGGVTSYTYNWSNGPTSKDNINIVAGSYTVTVTDANGCTATSAATIVQPTVLVANVVCSPISAPNASDGSSTASANGGATAYTYLWDSGETTTTLIGLAGNTTHTVTITDANGCTDIAFCTVPSISCATSATTTVTPALCNNQGDGTATATISGSAVSTFSYLWDDTNTQTSATASGLLAGTYHVVITDSDGCTATAIAIITEPSAIAISAVNTSILCNGDNNGTAMVTINGGNTPYSFNWSSGPTAKDISLLAAGTYTVTATDAQNCSVTTSVTITEPTPVVLTAIGTNISCNGQSDGTIVPSISGGVTPYAYSWNNGVTTLSQSGLVAGTYTATITDANSCTVTTTSVVSEPAAMTLTPLATDANCGAIDGSVSVVVIGGNTPYTFNWSNASSLQNQSGLVAGTYTLTVSDANGCSQFTTTAINNLGGGTAMATPTNVTCSGGSNGTATVSITGGSSPFSYIWSNGQTTTTANGFTQGVFSVTVVDNVNCIANASVTVTQPPIINTTITRTNVSCNGGSNGTANTTANGGSTPFSFSWSNGGTTPAINNLVADTLIVTVTDGNGCIALDSIKILEPVPLTSTSTATRANCGQSDGTTTVSSVAMGATPYSYLWDDSQNQITATATGLFSGNYNYTVTDANGCTTMGTQALIDNGSPTAITTPDNNVICNGGSEGQATVSATAGQTPYVYTWSNSSTTTLNTGLVAGVYTVTVTDTVNCSTISSVTITQPSAITGPITNSINVSGLGNNDGQATVSASGGTPSYTYNWSPAPISGQTTPTVTGLPGGTYCVTTTDANGCKISDCVTIIEPGAITPTAVATDVLCFGGNQGTATVTVNGGISPYTFAWNNGASTQNQTGLIAGSYSVTITDANGVGAISNIVLVNEPTAVIATITGNTIISCNGVCDGTATAAGSGGASPYFYAWNDAATQNTPTVNNLCAGSYSVTISDFNGCSAITTVTITEPAPLTSVIAPTNLNCFGNTNGNASITVSGGTPAYSYFWNDANFQATATATALVAGNYTVTVTDTHSCQLVKNITITQPTELLLGNTATLSTCNQSDGTATVTIISGSPSFTYQWNDSQNQTTATATGLFAGGYTVTVTDGNGCTAVINPTISDAGAPSVAVLTQTDVSCKAGSDGFAQIAVSGGTPPISFNWNDPQTQNTASATGLPAGTWLAAIVDASGCQAAISVDILEPSLVRDTVAAFSNISCFGANDGSATVVATGGTPAYTYSWNDANGQTSATATGLAPAIYTAIVTDANNCPAQVMVTITQPLPFTASTFVVPAFCSTPTGKACAVPSNGIYPLSYSWSNGQSDSCSVTTLPGSYTVTITDAAACATTATAVIPNIPAGVAVIANQTHVSCQGGSNGTATVSISGNGTSPYTYVWSNGNQTASTATGFPLGTYSVTVTDSNSCIAITTVSITEPATLSNNISVTNTSCNSICDGVLQATANGGVSPYTYLWNDPLAQNVNKAGNLCVGNYTVSITDANGCLLLDNALIAEPIALLIDTTVQNANCGQSDGAACVVVTGGSIPYTYLWQNGNTTTCINTIKANSYTVSVTDGQGCSRAITAVVADLSGPTAAIIDTTQVSCFGGNDGRATVAISGGAGSPSYQWVDALGNIMPSYNTPVAGNLAAGCYAVQITDGIGCSAAVPVCITQPTEVLFTAGSIDPICFNDCNGKAWVTVAGGILPYTIKWTDPDAQATDTAVGLCADTYLVIITDAKGCSKSNIFTLNNPLQVAASISQTEVNCFDGNDGTATIQTTTGVPPFTFNWNNGQSTPTAGGLIAGNYSVTITDANNCTSSRTTTVGQPTPITASIVDFGDASCSGICDGYTQVNAAGSTPPYNYLWSSGHNNQIATNLCAGDYIVTVTDANGCTVAATQSIAEPVVLAINILAKNQVSCFSLCDGTATSTASGGSLPYSYLWSGTAGFQTTPKATNLCAGIYKVTVTDGSGCSASSPVIITQPQALLLLADTLSPHCGQADGAIQVNVGGGTAPYTPLWNDPNTQTSFNATNLTAGCYTVVITDGAGCVSDNTFCINDINGPTVTLFGTNDISCFALCDGLINMDATGGTGSIAIAWTDISNGTDMSFFDDAKAAFQLCGGDYAVIATDAAGCVAGLTATIFEPTELVSFVTQSSNVSCFGLHDGAATLQAALGTPNYTYQWIPSSPSQITQHATGLAAGFYSAIVTDANGCTDTAQIVITEPPLLSLLATTTNISCFGGSNGGINTVGSGGIPPYNYNWNPTQPGNPTITNLTAGTYALTLTDGHNCSVNNTKTITQPTPLVASISMTPAFCSYANATATLFGLSGGVPNYSYQWSPNPQTTLVATALVAGNYTALITDANNCKLSLEVAINDQPSPVAAATTTPALCFESPSGTATAVITSGGTTPFTYLWDDILSQNTATATSLFAGIACVKITDANGCIANTCGIVTQPNAFKAIPFGGGNYCSGASDITIFGSAIGGTPAYSIAWTNQPSFGNNLGPILVNPIVNSQYCYAITDANGCSSNNCVDIIVSPPLQIDIPMEETICLGSSASLNATGFGGTAIANYVFTWDIINSIPDSGSATSGQTVHPTDTTLYRVILSDNCSAKDTAWVTVNVNPLPTALLAPVDKKGCPPFTTVINANSGLFNKATFEWDFTADGIIDTTVVVVGNSDSQTVVYPSSGIYNIMLIVTSMEGCQAVILDTNAINVLPAPKAIFSLAPNSLSLTKPFVSVNGSPSLSYTHLVWDFGDGNGASGVTAQNTYQDTGSYPIVLTAFNLFDCIDTAVQWVNVLPDYAMYTPNAFTPNGDGLNDFFFPKGIGISPSDNFLFEVYNRWGERVFKSNSLDKQWDGSIDGSSLKGPTAVYIWKIAATDITGKVIEKTKLIGHVSLLR